jgi:tetratricopeptide (TPR) repeat protein
MEQPAAAVGDARHGVSARRWPWLAAAGVGALVAALAVARVRWESAPARPLAVVVQEPRIALSPPDERSRFAAFAVREAANQVLAGLMGIDLIGPEELAEAGVPPQGAPRVVAADEVLGATIACEGQWCRVSVRRQAVDGRVVADSGSFEVSSASEDSLALANAVGIHLRRMYRNHPPRVREERLEVRSDDYSRFLSLRRANETGQVLGLAAVDELERLARSSPGLTEAHVLAVGVARRFLLDPARADRMLQEAEARHPADPRLVFERFLLRQEAGQLAAAETAVGELERLAPGDVRVSRARALLLIKQGRLAEAAEVRRRMVRERPSWRNLWYLANIEIDLADEPAARQHLDQLLALSPGNRRGLEKKAELEWIMGDPAAAARIYEELLGNEVTLANLINLGWSRLLAGDYAAAIGANRRALDLDPRDDDMLSQLNLGIAYEGAGDAEAARRLYRGLLDRLASAEGGAGLDRLLLQAQSLARLGRCVEAITVSKKALEDGKPRAQGLFQAAVIHALCREENHAIVYAREARKRGLSARWFGIPGFESLHARPEFRELVGAPASGPAASRGASP